MPEKTPYQTAVQHEKLLREIVKLQVKKKRAETTIKILKGEREGRDDLVASLNAKYKELNHEFRKSVDERTEETKQHRWQENAARDTAHRLNSTVQDLQELVDRFDWWMVDSAYKAPEQCWGQLNDMLREMHPDQRRKAKEASQSHTQG